MSGQAAGNLFVKDRYGLTATVTATTAAISGQ
jgi:hypothetical protein